MREVFGNDRIAFSGLDMDFDQADINAITRTLNPRNTQCAVVFLGEMPYTEFKGNVEDIELFENQQDLVRAIHAQGVPVIGVYVGGRPRTMYGIEAMLDAFVMAYLPGDYGARAIADVLSGAFNPSGRLPFTWPCHPSSHLTHDLKHTELEGDGFKPLFAFGDGLSYSTVNTTGLTVLSGPTTSMGDTVKVEVTLENTGDRSTTETVILYSQDRVASITPSVDELAAYKQVIVPGGATTTVTLDVPTLSLGFIGRENTYTCLLYTSPSPRDLSTSRMPSSA